MDNMSTESLEIDMIDFEGPAFESVDNRLMALYLVKYGLTHAAMFNASGKLVQPSDALYKKSVLVERSLFRPPTLLTMNILDSAYEKFTREPEVEPEAVLVLSEMTLQNLRDRDGDELDSDVDVDVEDFLQRVEILCALGKNVMISNFGEFYKLAQYLSSQTNKPVAIALGIANLLSIFNESYYENLDGGILEAFGLLFRNDMRLYVCPKIDPGSKTPVTVHSLQVQNHLRHLYLHLIDNDYIRNLDTIESQHLLIKSADVLKKIRNDDPSWINMVPEKVVNIINERGLFQKPMR
jgi:hypothetical protein